MDWSTDGNYLVVNSDKFELKFLNIKTGKAISASTTREIDWYTWTCVFGFPTLGVFPNLLGEDVDCVCRSDNRKILATGDDFDKVNIFNYPCVVPKSGSKSYSGHSSALARLRFCMSDNCLVSVGGKDKTVLVWATDFGDTHANADKFLEGMNIDFNP